MAHKRKDTLAKCLQWAVHLRPFGKREQSQRERNAAKKMIRQESLDFNRMDYNQEKNEKN